MEARRPSRIECPGVPEQPEPKNPGRVFHTERIAPRDATEALTEHLAHGGSGDDGVVDETYDSKVKIGEALEASAKALCDKPLEPSDAAAIRVAEASALGGGGDAGRVAIPGGVAERAQAAVAANACAARDEDKVTLTDVLTWETTVRLPTGKAVTSEVATAAAEAEAANDPRAEANPLGVSAALDMAAKHNSEQERAG